MKKHTYQKIESYMLSCMDVSGAHDADHIYRVLYHALEIAETEPEVDYDILITACLLHDIGRKEQCADPSLCHAAVGAAKAYGFLLEEGFPEAFASAVRDCIAAHRYRKDLPPGSTEAKILFDADKLDVTGAMGIARTLLYQGELGEVLYTRRPDGSVSDGCGDQVPSFFQEYQFKLKRVYDRFLTEKGAAMAQARQTAAAAFYEALLQEVQSAHIWGGERLAAMLEEA